MTARATVKRGEVIFSGRLGATIARLIFPAGELAGGRATADGDDADGRLARAQESLNTMYLAGMTATPEGMAPKSAAGGDGSTLHALALLTLGRMAGPIEATAG